jgi:hypothetical protein
MAKNKGLTLKFLGGICGGHFDYEPNLKLGEFRYYTKDNKCHLD